MIVESPAPMPTLTRAGLPEIALPPTNIRPGTSKGRVVAEGYQRGAGLEYGDLRAQVDAHPLFIKAMQNAQGRSLIAPDKLRSLFLILTGFVGELPQQNVIEFGSYRGGGALFMATILDALYPGAKVFAYDTFEGMPPTDNEMDLHVAGDFADTNRHEIEGAAASVGLDNLVLVPGFVEDTFPTQSPAGVRYALAHIDLDIYHPIRHVQRTLPNVMTPGGYVVYDDATASTCIGATQAVEDLVEETGARSEQIFPHFVFRSGLT